MAYTRAEYDQACEDTQRQRNEFYDNLIKIVGDSIKLKPVDIRAQKSVHKSEHDGIDGEKTYLIACSNQWQIGRFYKQWFGWTASIRISNVQLCDLDAVFEIELPALPPMRAPDRPRRFSDGNSEYCSDCHHDFECSFPNCDLGAGEDD